MNTQTEIRKGLAGVVADYTAVSKVSAETSSLLYRGYAVQDLAAKCSFEQVAYLLWNGELPTESQLAELWAFERSGRHLNPVVKRAIDELPNTSHPMDVCRTAVSVLGALHPLAEDSSPDANMKMSIDLWAAMPAIVAYDQRRRRGQDMVPPRDDLGYSANFLWMTFSEDPEYEIIEAFDVSMILHAEHSFNASTFTARVVTSTLSDLHSAVTSAIGALKGPLHGPNLDYPTGPAYHLMGFDTPTFTPIFVASRITGWTAHIMEQRASNSLIQPLSAYNGTEQRPL